MEAEEQQRPPAEGPGPGPGPRKEEEEDAMDAFLDKFRSQQYRGRLHEDTWEQELEKIPMFMKEAPSEINPQENPELACLQSLIFDDERPPEEQAKTYKDEGNDYFKDRDYKKAVASYTEGLRKKCSDPDLNAMLLTNRAAAQYHLGNLRSALNDAAAARKLRPSHLKAIIRGAICHLELRNFSEAVSWCDEGLRLDSKERKLLEIRVKADKLKRATERDLRKAKVKERKDKAQKGVLLRAVQARNIQVVSPAAEEDEEEQTSPHGGLGSENAVGARVSLDDHGRLSWPTLLLYPEYGQMDFISAFQEDSRFIDHLMVMFEELPPWDLERKYRPHRLEVLCQSMDTGLSDLGKTVSFLQEFLPGQKGTSAKVTAAPHDQALPGIAPGGPAESWQERRG
ncbi:tetratricopeptide repeat protein 4 isoform X2 [Phascolarctos cinereus]|uniref:Tetratricopeptide repeat protein 4 isoform X2 n=1 Tax=Phascolarctos cinereus TaxID=38626 RepID=A0A6P5JMZ3_PHACI|nr:tetratricopeptide repeat protein 4 isoform X2 [Phascolarctos cinereus]